MSQAARTRRSGSWLEPVPRVLAFSLAALLSCWLTRPLAAELRVKLDAQLGQLGGQPGANNSGGSSAFAGRAPGPKSEAPPLRVLFVGNSLTAQNRMPSMLAKLAAAAGEPRALEPNLLTPGGYHLYQHAADGTVERRLARTRFDFVVLQNQGQVSGWPHEREKHMLAPGRTLNALIVQAGARPLLYETFARREGDFSTFPGDTYEAMQARIDEGYEALGREIGAPVVPVGRVWQETLRVHPVLKLWALDGQHPSVAGSYLVACVFLQQLYARSPVGNPYQARLEPADARAIQESVARELAIHH